MFWYDSMDPVQAVKGIENLSDRQLLDVAYSARSPYARRLALIRLNDSDLFRVFALTDPSPDVRRRMVREINDKDTLEEIIEKDTDRSVRLEAINRLEKIYGKEDE